MRRGRSGERKRKGKTKREETRGGGGGVATYVFISKFFCFEAPR